MLQTHSRLHCSQRDIDQVQGRLRPRSNRFVLVISLYHQGNRASFATVRRTCNATAASIIISWSLRYYEAPILGSPFTFNVKPAVTCAAKSQAFGPGLSCATAGAISAFTMITRDAYENSRTAGGDAVVAHEYPVLTSKLAAHAIVTDVGDSMYHAMFTPVVSGMLVCVQ